MELGTRDTLLTLGSGLMFVGGIALIAFGDFLLATVGIVLITMSAIVFLVDAKDLLVKTDRNSQK